MATCIKSISIEGSPKKCQFGCPLGRLLDEQQRASILLGREGNQRVRQVLIETQDPIYAQQVTQALISQAFDRLTPAEQEVIESRTRQINENLENCKRYKSSGIDQSGAFNN